MASQNPSTPDSSSTINAPAMDSLLQACSSGNADQLCTLLASPTSKEVALAHEDRAYNAIRISIPNLRRLLERAAKSGQAPSVETLLEFAHANKVAKSHTMI